MFSMVDAPPDCELSDASTKIRVLELGKNNWDAIRDVAHSGSQEEAFYVMDVDDIIGKHNEWKLKMPRITTFYGNFYILVRLIILSINVGI